MTNQRKFEGLTFMLRIFGSHWFKNQELQQPRDLAAKRSHSQEISQPRDLTAKRSRSQEISQPRSLRAKRSHSQEISQPRDLTAKRSHSQEISQPRSLRAKRSHSQEISQPRSLRAKRSHSQEISQPRDLTAKRSHRQEISQPRDLTAKLRCHIFHFQVLREVSHESFAFTSSTFTFWGMSRAKTSFSHLQLSDFEGGLARKLRFHIFNFQILREVSHESFVFTSSTFTFSGRSRTKASFSHLQLSDFQGGLARKLRFHIFNCRNLKEVSHESFVFTSSTFTFSERSCTKASFSHLQLSDFEGRLKSRTKASFSQLQLSDFQGGLARKLRFHSFNFQIFREVSHESFVFTSSTFRFSGRSRTKATFSHLQLSEFEGGLARKLRFATCRFWRMSRTKASFSHLQLSLRSAVGAAVLLRFATQCLQIAL